MWSQTASASSAAWPDPLFGPIPVSSAFQVPAGGGSLDVTPDPVRLSGLLQWEGAAIPGSGSNQLWIVMDPVTGGEQLWVPRSATSPVNTYDIPALPGTWDVSFSWVTTASASSASWPDPLFGDLEVATVTVPGGGGTANLEPDPLRLTGLLRWDAAAVPASGSNAWDVVFVDPYSDLELHAPRTASSGAINTYDVPVWPGVWHIELRWQQSASASSASWPDPIWGALRVATCRTVL